ncbi:SIR2 family protein [Enterococcus faecalis]|uniref:ABC-three component system protein n=1 Tax=Enterococcus faecalis TaxID=1351 RepID=UPI0025B022E6|nr:ABC-three component system protein [Enterococcus faecalis]MDN3095150.1 SIR2 family protein [Enterococcus faecalis]
MSQYFVDQLKKKYHEKKVIPFIGAGLSVPFDLKPWPNLINELKETLLDSAHWPAVDFDLDIKNYQEAIESIKKFGYIADQPIQEKISLDYSLRKNELIPPIDNNYADLKKDNFKVYLTTNYDRLLDDYLPGVNGFNSLTDYTSNVPRLFENAKEKYLFHIHGCVSNPDSIVISSEKYNSIYSDAKFDSFMTAFSSNYSFLFLGFSFDDVFVQELVKNHKEFFQGTHYMITSSDSMDSQKRDSLSKDYGIHIIEYNTENSSHIKEIRKLLMEITGEQAEVESEKDDAIVYSAVGIEELLTNEISYEDNLFYRKLQLENISEDLLDVSKYFYIAAEKFVRKSKKFGLPKEFIDGILAEVFMTYKEKYSQIYFREGKSSEELLIEIHKNLEQINIDRLVNESNKPTGSESKGFIHVLADDREKDIWWGSDRL